LEQERQARAPVVEKKVTGKFAVFIDENEEEERKERDEEAMRLKIEEEAAALVAKREAEFPTCGLKSAVVKTDPVTNHWAAMAQHAATLPLPKPKAKAVVEQKSKAKATAVGWADDSDDEYNEEMYESVVNNNDGVNITYYSARATADDNDW
jgi:hypothetical protein